MNIAGAVLNSLNQNEVGKLNDRCFFTGSCELVEIDFFERFARDLDLIIVPRLLVSLLLLGILDDVLHATAFGGVGVVELVNNRLFGGDHRRNVETGNAANVVNGEDVQRISHCEEKS